MLCECSYVKLTDDVTGVGADEHETNQTLLLGVTSGILRRPGIDQRADTRVERDQVVTREQLPTVVLVVGNGQKHDDADN